MKRLMACSIFALYPVIAVCAPDTNAISKAQTFDELKNAYKNAAEQVITEYESQGVDSFEIVSVRTQYQENITALTDAQSDKTLDQALTESESKSEPESSPESEPETKMVLSEEDARKQIAELQENADAMREKEQSLANRMIGGASMGAMGIGGMQMASALAEQNANADAERDMTAYLATFRCDYGAGLNITGGEKNITLPGANALLNLRQEYIALAADLQARKTALELTPGLESQIISDASESGLYDNESIGKTDGVFTSLSRALSDSTSADAAEWAAQKSDTASQLKTGAIIAGAGALVGIAGNILTNYVGDKPQEMSDEIIAKYNALRQSITIELQPIEQKSKEEAVVNAPITEPEKAPEPEIPEQISAEQTACKTQGVWDDVLNTCTCNNGNPWLSYEMQCMPDEIIDTAPTPVFTLYNGNMFDSGKINLNNTENLDNAIKILQEKTTNETNFQIILVAHTDNQKIIQSKPLCATQKICNNNQLAAARAESVKEYIANKWILPSGATIETKSAGDDCATGKDNESRKLDRKLDVYIFFNGENPDNLQTCATTRTDK